jgi:hypothetical protein
MEFFMYDMEQECGGAAVFALAVFIFVIAYCRITIGTPPPQPPGHQALTNGAPETGDARDGVCRP